MRQQMPRCSRRRRLREPFSRHDDFAAAICRDATPRRSADRLRASASPPPRHAAPPRRRDADAPMPRYRKRYDAAHAPRCAAKDVTSPRRALFLPPRHVHAQRATRTSATPIAATPAGVERHARHDPSPDYNAAPMRLMHATSRHAVAAADDATAYARLFSFSRYATSPPYALVTYNDAFHADASAAVATMPVALPISRRHVRATACAPARVVRAMQVA